MQRGNAAILPTCKPTGTSSRAAGFGWPSPNQRGSDLMARTGALHGYARVSTGEQTLESQIRELRAAGCVTVAEERASGGDPSRPVLADLLDRLAAGDTLVVVRLDRLGRSLLHLLETITSLQARGVHFRSLGDPVDTASPQGRFTLQILGAMAEFERALIRERTMSGLAAARAEGRIGGNPGLVSGDRTMLSRLRLARRDAFLERLNRSAGDWAPDVRRLRPEMPWQDVLAVVNSRLQDSRRWTLQRRAAELERMRPNISQPVGPIFHERVRQAGGQLNWGLLQNSGRFSLARPQQPGPDERLTQPVAGSRRRRQAGNRRASVKNLNLATAANFADIARQICLQVRDRYRRHND